MGQVPEKDIKRDNALIYDYKSAIKLGESKFMMKLQNKYNLSAARIYQILDSYGVVRKGKIHGRKKGK